MDESGRWKSLAAEPQTSEAPEPQGLRRAAAHEAKARGVDYLLIYDGDFADDDLRKNAVLWGVTLLGEHNGARLYRFD
jgi:hypothetical protein